MFVWKKFKLEYYTIIRVQYKYDIVEIVLFQNLIKSC